MENVAFNTPILRIRLEEVLVSVNVEGGAVGLILYGRKFGYSISVGNTRLNI